MTNKKGRPRISLCQPISVTFTDAQRAWLESRIRPGGTYTAVVRDLIQDAMEQEAKESEHDLSHRLGT